MAIRRTYNNFYLGIAQDNFLSGGAKFIDTQHLDGLEDGYGIKLSKAPQKQLFTNGPIRKIMHTGLGADETDNGEAMLAGDGGEIYRMDSADNTPAFTLTRGGTAQEIATIGYIPGFYVIFSKNTGTTTSYYGYGLYRGDDLSAGVWSDDPLLSSFNNIPLFQTGSFLYAGGYSSTYEIGEDLTSARKPETKASFGFPSRQVVGLTLQGTIIGVYTEDGNVYLWDGDNANYSALSVAGGRIAKVFNHNGTDFIYMEDGQLKVGQGTQTQNLTRPNISKRLEDNTINTTKFKFNLADNLDNNVMCSVLNNLYLASNDTDKGLYKYGNIIPGLQNGFHKVLTTNHEGTQIDEIYDMIYIEKINKLYFSYKAGAKYGVDYIDLSDNDTNYTDGYAVTEIFSGGTTQNKYISSMQITTSNVSGNNYINVYYRVNNGDWELLRQINHEESIKRDIINTVNGQKFKDFIDVQFKIEFHGETLNPTLHEFNFIYDERQSTKN